MADSIKIGNLDISAFKVGSDDCKVYLGDTLLYPQGQPPTPTFQGKWLARYSGGQTYEKDCDGNTTLTSGDTRPTGYERSAMTSSVIGQCVTSIGERAFQNCRGLTSCTIGSGVTSISYRSFNNCSSLTSIDIPNNVTSIGEYAFNNCSSLTSIDIPSGVTSISGGIFNGCTGLTSVTIGSGVTSIGNSAFGGCSSLTSIDIPNGVTSIGDYTFYQCRSLRSCTIGSGVASIGGDAFYGCSGLTSVTVNATTPPKLGSYVFYNTTCPILVPSASVNAYKSASGWSDYASRIQAIPNS